MPSTRAASGTSNSAGNPASSSRCMIMPSGLCHRLTRQPHREVCIPAKRHEGRRRDRVCFGRSRPASSRPLGHPTRTGTACKWSAENAAYRAGRDGEDLRVPTTRVAELRRGTRRGGWAIANDTRTGCRRSRILGPMSGLLCRGARLRRDGPNLGTPEIPTLFEDCPRTPVAEHAGREVS